MFTFWIESCSPSLFAAFIAIEKNGTVAHPDLALAFVKAFFHRRDIQVKKQKAILAEDEDAEDEVNT